MGIFDAIAGIKKKYYDTKYAVESVIEEKRSKLDAPEQEYYSKRRASGMGDDRRTREVRAAPIHNPRVVYVQAPPRRATRHKVVHARAQPARPNRVLSPWDIQANAQKAMQNYESGFMHFSKKKPKKGYSLW